MSAFHWLSYIPIYFVAPELRNADTLLDYCINKITFHFVHHLMTVIVDQDSSWYGSIC